MQYLVCNANVGDSYGTMIGAFTEWYCMSQVRAARFGIGRDVRTLRLKQAIC